MAVVTRVLNLIEFALVLGMLFWLVLSGRVIV
jgi:hypothetical protein